MEEGDAEDGTEQAHEYLHMWGCIVIGFGSEDEGEAEGTETVAYEGDEGEDEVEDDGGEGFHLGKRKE